MSEMKNLYTEEQEKAAEEMLGAWFEPSAIRKRYADGSAGTQVEVAALLEHIDHLEERRLDEMKHYTSMIRDITDAAIYWRKLYQEAQS